MTSKEYQKLALTLKKGGATFDEAQGWLKQVSNGGYEELLPQIVAIWQNKDGNMSQRIADYVTITDGYFSITEMYKDLQVITADAKNAARVALHRMVKSGELEKSTAKDGVYRRVQNELEVIDWKNADPTATVDIKLPLGIHNWVNLYKTNPVILAGSTSAGKTAFIIQTIGLNQGGPYPIVLLSSETSDVELRRRISKADPMLQWKFGAFSRGGNFADVIAPDAINIIDYMEVVDGKAYMIADEIKKIVEKLKNGIAIIAIQKKFGAEYGYGAEFSAWKSRLYMSMEYHKEVKEGSLTILKATNPKVEGLLPRYWKWTYKLHYGYDFEILSEPDELMEYQCADPLTNTVEVV